MARGRTAAAPGPAPRAEAARCAVSARGRMARVGERAGEAMDGMRVLGKSKNDNDSHLNRQAECCIRAGMRASTVPVRPHDFTASARPGVGKRLRVRLRSQWVLQLIRVLPTVGMPLPAQPVGEDGARGPARIQASPRTPMLRPDGGPTWPAPPGARLDSGSITHAWAKCGIHEGCLGHEVDRCSKGKSSGRPRNLRLPACLHCCTLHRLRRARSPRWRTTPRPVPGAQGGW